MAGSVGRVTAACQPGDCQKDSVDDRAVIPSRCQRGDRAQGAACPARWETPAESPCHSTARIGGERLVVEGLQGIQVIQTATVLAGPMAARLLADWGADVIR